jgi:hypothetical protein
MTHEQHLILDDGPRAGLLAPDAVLDSDAPDGVIAGVDFRGDLRRLHELLPSRESILKAATLPSEECARRAACPPGTIHPVFEGVFAAHFGGAK